MNTSFAHCSNKYHCENDFYHRTKHRCAYLLLPASCLLRSYRCGHHHCCCYPTSPVVTHRGLLSTAIDCYQEFVRDAFACRSEFADCTRSWYGIHVQKIRFYDHTQGNHSISDDTVSRRAILRNFQPVHYHDRAHMKNSSTTRPLFSSPC